jgi:Bacteriophage tail sheath protein
MPTTVSYPGIYIEEVPSPVRTITGVATSITAFVGYSHPFKTSRFNHPTRIFNFTEYERTFGGLFHSSTLPNHLPYAVQQFFLNGGTDGYVVGLASTGASAGSATAQDAAGAGAIVFTAHEITDGNNPIQIRIKSGVPPDGPTEPYDVEVTYRGVTEVFRRVYSTLTTDPDHIDNYIETRLNGVSTLVTVTAPPEGYKVPQQYGYNPSEPKLQITEGTAGTPAPVLAEDFAQEEPAPDKPKGSGIFPLEDVQIFNLLCLPGISDQTTLDRALTFVEKRRAFLIIDPPQGQDWQQIQDRFEDVPKGTNGAFYYPWLQANDPLDGTARAFPPSGYVAGIYARTDAQRGVWKAPAGTEALVRGVVGGEGSVESSGILTDQRQGVLNKQGINAIRTFPVYNTIVWGARTLVGADQLASQWKYVPVRRTALFIEETLYQGLKWVVFEPNDEPLWASIRLNVTAFMTGLFRQGAFQGRTPREAFLVKCDRETNPQEDINRGIVNILVGFAPLKPAEFVIIKISQLAGQAQA